MCLKSFGKIVFLCMLLENTFIISFVDQLSSDVQYLVIWHQKFLSTLSLFYFNIQICFRILYLISRRLKTIKYRNS